MKIKREKTKRLRDKKSEAHSLTQTEDKVRGVSASDMCFYECVKVPESRINTGFSTLFVVYWKHQNEVVNFHDDTDPGQETRADRHDVHG